MKWKHLNWICIFFLWYTALETLNDNVAFHCEQKLGMCTLNDNHGIFSGGHVGQLWRNMYFWIFHHNRTLDGDSIFCRLVIKHTFIHGANIVYNIIEVYLCDWVALLWFVPIEYYPIQTGEGKGYFLLKVTYYRYIILLLFELSIPQLKSCFS